jgi:hypothetical protein
VERERGEFSRRNLLKGAAGASIASGVAVVVSTNSADAYSPPGDEARARYRESDHVKAFYRTNGYETKNKN